MNRFQPYAGRLVKGPTWPPPDFFKPRTYINHFVSAWISYPKDFRNVIGRVAEKFERFTQARRGFLVLFDFHLERFRAFLGRAFEFSIQPASPRRQPACTCKSRK